MSLFTKFRKSNKSGRQNVDRLSPREDMKPFTSKFRPSGKGMRDEATMKAVFRRAQVLEMLPPADPFPEIPGKMPQHVACWRLRRLEVTVGQQWILRIKLFYRFVTTFGETLELAYAAPEGEVKPTRFIGGRISSTTVSREHAFPHTPLPYLN